MVCQKERHVDPMLPVLKVGKSTSTDKGLLTGIETYEGAMMVALGVVVTERIQ